MHNYVCSNCGETAFYDGRCGDGPVLVCDCTRHGRWIDDGRGGYYDYLNNARPIDASEFNWKSKNSNSEPITR